MDRNEFMEQLEYLLLDIPQEEKEDALAYYRDYLDEAGDDAENALKEFGSPERIAAIIRSDLAGGMEEGGEFTERGFEDERFKDPRYQVAERLDLPEIVEGQEERRRDGEKREGKKGAPRCNRILKIILWIILFMMGAPLLVGAGGAAVGVTAAVLGVLIALIALMGVLTLALLLGGIALCIVGVIAMAGWIPGGLLLFGAGMVVMGVGILSLWLSVLFYGRFLPGLVRWVVDGISRIFHRRRTV